MSSTETTSPSKSQRLISLDALRGFDMFWIAGGGAVLKTAAAVTGWAWLVSASTHLEHPEWHGFTFYDLIFPLFLFIAGVSMPFSFEKRLEQGCSKASLYRHTIFRGLMLVFLGLIYNGFLKFDWDWESFRCASVLGRIGLAYLFAGLIVLNTQFRGRAIWFTGILITYWLALKFIPIPEFGAGDLAPGHTLTDWFDRTFMPGKLYKTVRDPEGLLGTVPAIATCLSGVMTGQLLKNQKKSGYFKVGIMLAIGLVSLLLSQLWNLDFPINKNLWSSSFVLHCTGWSLILLALFYLVIDVWKFQSWAFFFIVIGSNSILIYMAPGFIDFDYTTLQFFGGMLKYTGTYQLFATAVAVLAVKWFLLYVCYRHKIFLKV